MRNTHRSWSWGRNWHWSIL